MRPPLGGGLPLTGRRSGRLPVLQRHREQAADGPAQQAAGEDEDDVVRQSPPPLDRVDPACDVRPHLLLLCL